MPPWLLNPDISLILAWVIELKYKGLLRKVWSSEFGVRSMPYGHAARTEFGVRSSFSII